jgi:hypothetical protein
MITGASCAPEARVVIAAAAAEVSNLPMHLNAPSLFHSIPFLLTVTCLCI